jgi:hypothetical protein
MYIEYRPILQLMSISPPPAYSKIADSDLPGSVITLPMGWEGGDNLIGIERTYAQLFQIEHERPLIGGMLARVPKEQIYSGAYTPVIDFLADPVNLSPSDLDKDPEAIARFQDRYYVAYIVAHKRTPEHYLRGAFKQLPSGLSPESLVRLDRYITNYLDMELFDETDDILAYRLTDEQADSQ